jgi:ABC-type sugar transport system substrate-binding protein
VSQIPSDLGYKAADVADDFFAGKQVPKDALLPVDLVTKANIDKFQAPCTY